MDNPECQKLANQIAKLDEEDVVAVVSSVLCARPETASKIVAFAVPDLAYPPQKALLERREEGTIKSFNETQGFGFIDCPALKEQYEKDVFVHRGQMGYFRSGQRVSFAVMMSKEDLPQGYDLQPVDGQAFPDAHQSIQPICPPNFQTIPDMWLPAPPRVPRQERNRNKHQEGNPIRPLKRDVAPWTKVPVHEVIGDESVIVGEFNGTIKSFSANTGYGFIDCPDLMAQFGKDTFLVADDLSTFSVGDEVRFDAYFNLKGNPQARNLRDRRRLRRGGGKSRRDVAPWTKASAEPDSAVEGPTIGQFVGTIKSFSMNTGYGFIDCNDLRADFEKDTFLRGDDIGDFSEGDKVRFDAYLNPKGNPQARNLQAVKSSKRARTA